MIPSVRATEAGIAQRRSQTHARCVCAMWRLVRQIWVGDQPSESP